MKILRHSGCPCGRPAHGDHAELRAGGEAEAPALVEGLAAAAHDPAPGALHHGDGGAHVVHGEVVGVEDDVEAAAGLRGVGLTREANPAL